MDEYDCRNEQTRMWSVVKCDKDGKVEASGDVIDQWRYIPPETVLEKEFEMICRCYFSTEPEIESGGADLHDADRFDREDLSQMVQN